VDQCGQTGKPVGRRNAYTTLSDIMRLAVKYEATYKPGQSPCQVDGRSHDYSKTPRTGPGLTWRR